MKKLSQLALIMILIITNGCWLFSKAKSRVEYFAPGSLYFYLMGSYNHFSPPQQYSYELGYDHSDAFAPVLGLGYRVIQMGKSLFISIEGDYTPASYNFDEYVWDQKISVFTLMVNMEGTISKKFPVILYGGLGMAIHHFADLGYEDYWGDWISTGDDNKTVLALDIGLKFPISRNLYIRTEMQWNGNVDSGTVYDDEGVEDDWTEWDFLSSSFSVGLELHF
jgi:opacity protein-like surface antigen